MCSALLAVAISSINTGIPIFILQCPYFSSSMLLTVDVSSKHVMGPKIVLCFTTSLTCILSVFPASVLIIISVSLSNSHKVEGIGCLGHSLSYAFLVDSSLAKVY